MEDAHSIQIYEFIEIVGLTELRRIKLESLQEISSFCSEMALHLNTGNEERIVKYYGLDKLSSSKEVVERLEKNTKFLGHLAESIKI
jgi:hypothetical protein